jgi:hypothetical protein
LPSCTNVYLMLSDEFANAKRGENERNEREIESGIGGMKRLGGTQIEIEIHTRRGGRTRGMKIGMDLGMIEITITTGGHTHEMTTDTTVTATATGRGIANETETEDTIVIAHQLVLLLLHHPLCRHLRVLQSHRPLRPYQVQLPRPRPR